MCASSPGRHTFAISPPCTTSAPDNVYSGEGEVALAFIEDIMGHLGAMAEQIDRERARAHDELFGRT